MKLAFSAASALATLLLVTPAVAEPEPGHEMRNEAEQDDIPEETTDGAGETTRELKESSEDAQEEMDDVGEAATDSADETSGEMKQPSDEAQEEMDTVGEDAMTGQEDEAEAGSEN